MSGHDIIVIGASAGGVEALRELARGLPEDLPAAIFVVVHFPAESVSVLPQILNRVGPLPAAHAVDGEAVETGRIYVASPGLHMLLEPGRVRLVHGPTENRHRPAVDALFRSAARSYGPRVIGVVLTGALDDGTAGLHLVKQRGGLAVVQDPDDAFCASMPLSAREHVDTDACVPVSALADTLSRLAGVPAPAVEPDPTQDEIVAAAIAEIEMGNEDAPIQGGHVSAFTCPDCNGTLWETEEDGHLRFRCRVGHGYASEAMLASQDESTERALWAALRALEESAALSRRMAAGARRRGTERLAERFVSRAREATENAAIVRNLLFAASEASSRETVEADSD